MKVNRVKLSESFRTDTPVLPDVQVIEGWGYYDGVMFGICVVHDEKFFFMDNIYDIWRNYEDGTYQRLWSIFAVYDISIEDAEKVIGDDKAREMWQREIEELSECVGIFWKYEKAGEFKKWCEQ